MIINTELQNCSLTINHIGTREEIMLEEFRETADNLSEAFAKLAKSWNKLFADMFETIGKGFCEMAEEMRGNNMSEDLDEICEEIREIRESDNNYVIGLNENKEIDVFWRDWYEDTDDCLSDRRFHTKEEAYEFINERIGVFENSLPNKNLLSPEVLRNMWRIYFGSGID